MMKRLTFLIFVLVACAPAAAAQEAESVYTDLGQRRCQTIQRGRGSSTQECRGVGGYRLHVLDDDDRQSITVVKPDGTRHPLDLWHTVSGFFSTVGPRAEWRVRRRGGKAEPYALIVRFNVNRPPDGPQGVVSYLVVARLAPGKVCVTDKIESGPRANLLARRAADSSATKPCLPPDGERN